MIILGIIISSIYLIFQILYVIIPLQTTGWKKRNDPMVEEEQGISILVPAYNEQLVLKNCIDAITNVHYSKWEALIINDGSTDQSMTLLHEYLSLENIELKKANKLFHASITGLYRSKKYPNIYVIDKENGGKADALNAGIEYAKHDIVITMDADSMLAKDSLYYMNRGFTDKEVIAAGGTVHIAQGIKKSKGVIKPIFTMKSLVKCQVIQYLDSFFLRKLTQSRFGSMTVIAGAFGAFRRDILFKVNGYRSTVGEDMDITLKFQKYIFENSKRKKKFRLIYIPEALCYTECPGNLIGLSKQRLRWQRAFIDCVIEYWEVLFDGFSKSMSVYLLLDGFILGTLYAFTTLFFLINLFIGGAHNEYILILLITSVVIALIQDILCLIVSYSYGFRYRLLDYMKILFFLPFEICIYRFLGLLFTVIGTISYFFTDHHWGTAERMGDFSIT